MPGKAKSAPKAEELLHLPDAASQLGISVPTIKQWIYKKKIRSIKTTGGHHRIPQSELDRLLFKTGVKRRRNAPSKSSVSADAINSWGASIRCASAD